MLGIFILVLASWTLLYFLESKSILALGFTPPIKRILSFAKGFICIGLICAIVQYADASIHAEKFMLNPSLDISLFFSGLFFDFKSVLTEELVFRGAVLYILIKRTKPIFALIISGAVFGIYHWFSFGIIGNYMAMIIVFIATGITGYSWALAFKKSESILVPAGLHLGWNFVFNTVFSKGPLGEIIFVKAGENTAVDGQSFVSFLLQMLVLPICSLVYVK